MQKRIKQKPKKQSKLENKMNFENTKESFEMLKKELDLLKDNANDWIMFLHKNQQDIIDKLNLLEEKLKDIELITQR